ncbi:RNA-directed DNA polymerase from mobile element jockey-like [Rhizophagus irregularis DAOM 181602=DAOM 197198]|nr:RNA-directed DNA polymerase from mobile element jockey-like [Rhizophagus irregularis DAOM 181602=DAOM 197198]
MMDNKKHNFSPHPSPFIKFGQINVNGLCSPSYWSCSSSSRPHDGVGILLRNPLHKHVQTIDPWKGRLLKLDLFFHQTKISIISIYYPPSGSVHQSICNDLIAKLLSWLDYARTNNYSVIILGDFNIDEVAHSNYSHNHFRLLRLLSSQFFTDHQAHSSTDGPDPTFFHDNGSSRLDYIWSSPGFPAPGLFSQVVTCPNLLDRPFTDHKVLITVFDFSSCLAILAKSRLKQKKELRTIFSYASTSVEQWNNFTTEVDDSLGVYLDRQYYLNFDFSSLSLDRMWHALKAAIIGAAIETLPFHKVSNTRRHSYSPELTKLIAINKFLDRFLYRLTTHHPNRPTQLAQMTAALPSHLDDLATLLSDYSVPTYSTTPASVFKSFLRSQKNLVSAFLSTKFAQHLTDSVEYYTALRDEHFSNSLGTFIDSALSVEKRSIVLDRVLVVLDSTPTLLTDPSDIKQATISHFQSIVSPPLVHYSSITSFPARWQQAYTPLANVSTASYDPVLAPISLQEWSAVISSMPNNKASGPSKISYEMIKHLSGEALDFSLLLANTCLSHGDIPADWREAVVYPISKPHEFDAQLKNTRPITLLETVQKCVIKVVTNRLSNILADGKILQGGNFAGLPGGSTDVPIKMLDAIIHQQKHDSTNEQELWIVSQDISKAFDSMDLNMLKLALDRLHIPALLVRFILNLFTRRNNKIITCHGDTAAYRVRVGIDQGEIISPLLWVIYLDPLLTVLNQQARDPFILKSSALLNYSPLEFEQCSLPISHLTFMDDSTLIASSKSGIEDRLSITAEFYTLNNVQANSAKYVLLSSSSPSSKITFELSPSFIVSNTFLSLSSLPLNTSFRFLGVWFSLSASSNFVLKQARSMVKDMAALLGPKKLLAQHVAYLYNAVLLPRLEFRLQTTLFSESTIQSIVKPMFSVLRRKAGLAATTPLPLLFLKLPFSIQNAFYRFLSSHIASWQKIFTHPDFKDFALYAISYLQGYLGAESCPTTINLEPWSQIISLRTHTLFNSLLFSSRLNITWSLSFRPPRRDLQPALPLRSILPHSIFQSSWKLWKNLNIFVLAQLVSPCERYLMNWLDLRYLGIVGRKGRIPNWFTFINNNFLSSSSSSLLLSLYFINSSFTLASICLLDHTVKDYQFYPQWAINLDSATQTLSVGRVCITYKKQNSAIMSHWLPVSTSADERSYNPCSGCAFNIPALSKKSAIKQRFFAAYLPITLSTSWSYATSLALVHFSNASSTLSPSFKDRIDDNILPLSVQNLYTDSSFHLTNASSPSSMTSAWIALDDDGLVLESSSMHLPSYFPSALRSEISAVLLGLSALSHDSSISIHTDCSQLISLWTRFVAAPFSPKLLREPNHLLWLSIRQLIMDRNLNVDLIKVPAHGDDIYNIQADSLAKDAHSSLQPAALPSVFCYAPCLLTFNSLPIDVNIRHFLRSIADARALLSFCSLARFTALGSPSLFDWAGIYFCLSQIKGFASHRNGRPEFWIFCIKLLLDMLPTLTTLQQRKPYLYSPDWLCPQCNSAPEDLNHLWTCPYILPELNPCLTHRSEVIKFRDSCLSSFLSLKSLDISFQTEFFALDCWNYEAPSSSCLWLTRGLLPAHLTAFLNQHFPLSVIYKTISPLLNDFQIELYGEIWLCRNVLFHAWEESQGISAASKLRGPSTISSFIATSLQKHNSSLATVSQDSWISWISSSIIRGGSWISHLDFLRRLTVQPLRVSFW